MCVLVAIYAKRQLSFLRDLIDIFDKMKVFFSCMSVYSMAESYCSNYSILSRIHDNNDEATAQKWSFSVFSSSIFSFFIIRCCLHLTLSRQVFCFFVCFFLHCQNHWPEWIPIENFGHNSQNKKKRRIKGNRQSTSFSYHFCHHHITFYGYNQSVERFLYIIYISIVLNFLLHILYSVQHTHGYIVIWPKFFRILSYTDYSNRLRCAVCVSIIIFFRLS